MANVQHSALTGAELHEPKGVATATADQVYVADGAASGAWQKITNTSLNGISSNGTADRLLVADGSGGFSFQAVPHGRVHFFNTSTPHSVTYPSVYTKVNPTTTASGMSIEVTEGTNARLTYTGTATRHFHIACDASMRQASGSARDIQIAVYKNGAVISGSEKVQTTTSGTWESIALHADVSLATNDYIEIYIKNNGASGDVEVAQLYMFMMTMPGM